MSRLTLRLPETLHSQLKTVAQYEGVSLNQYIVYALTRQVTLTYTVQAVPENIVEQQRAQFKELLQNLGQASDAEIKKILAEREIAEPEAELSPDVVARLQKRMTGEWSSTSK